MFFYSQKKKKITLICERRGVVYNSSRKPKDAEASKLLSMHNYRSIFCNLGIVELIFGEGFSAAHRTGSIELDPYVH